MPKSHSLERTFIHLRDGGDAEPIELTPAFWGESVGSGAYDRVVGIFAFDSPDDLHPGTQEMHPEADEVIFLVSGALDVVLEEEAGDRTVSLAAGRFAIVPRGVWHRLVMRAPGRLLFVNSRTGMQSRSL